MDPLGDSILGKESQEHSSKLLSMSRQTASEFLPPTLVDWRKWLHENHLSEKGLWVVFGKKNSGVQSISLAEAIDEAVCFGWIDSVINSIDEKHYKIYFSPRSPQSNWSRVNKNKVARLEKAGRLQPAGLELIRIAKENGTWTALDDVENLIVPPDLQIAFDAYPQAEDYWKAFPRSVKRGILEWILNAKRAPTRAKRIEETARLAAQNLRANQYPKQG